MFGFLILAISCIFLLEKELSSSSKVFPPSITPIAPLNEKSIFLNFNTSMVEKEYRRIKKVRMRVIMSPKVVSQLHPPSSSSFLRFFLTNILPPFVKFTLRSQLFLFLYHQAVRYSL